MAKTDQLHICKQYVVTQLFNIKQQLDQCNLELTTQAQTSASSTLILLPSQEILDNCLKEYVCLQQNYLFKRMDQQLIKCKNEIRDQQLYRHLSAYNITIAQQQAIQQLINLRQQQLEVYEEVIILNERILHQFLPPNFDQLEEYIAQDYYWPPIADHTLPEMKTKRRKILQKIKRNLLNMYMYAYRFKINDYQQQYEQLLDQIELNFSSNTMIINEQSLFNAIKLYMIHRTNRIKEEIYHKIIDFRQILTHRRQRSSTAKKAISVSPQVTVNVLHHTLHDDELDHLSLGKTSC